MASKINDGAGPSRGAQGNDTGDENFSDANDNTEGSGNPNETPEKITKTTIVTTTKKVKKPKKSHGVKISLEPSRKSTRKCSMIASR